MLKKQLEKVLPLVEKPGRYVGGEWNSIKKDWNGAGVRFVLAFPDIYEIGMSNLGLQILYGLVNREKEFLMERTFAPWPDMEQQMRENQIPLFSLESFSPLSEFDIVGFSLQYELNYTNILNMLDLARIPLRARERNSEHPLIIAGGPCAFNPEPLSEFIDLFLIGEAENIILDILRKYASLKEEHGKPNKESLMSQLIHYPGVYVPKYYELKYNPSGTVKFRKAESPAPERVTKTVVNSLDRVFPPTAPIVPNIEVIHDRMMVEVARGCAQGCRFCQAGTIYRPLREKSLDLIEEQADKQALSTGHGEISLVSLNTADYSCISELTDVLSGKMAEKGISISLPSLRVDRFSVDLARRVQQVRKSTLTFAPEAGTQRLRNVINKKATREDLICAASAAFESGWDKIKLYFMIGLPTETYRDLDGIVEMANEVLDRGREVRKNKSKKRVEVTVSISSFVPKAHTPFQWAEQDEIETLKEKQDYLKDRLRGRGLKLNWHDALQSFLEAVISKGNRDLAHVIYCAWKRGCKFDGWSEHFKFGEWENALREADYTPSKFVNSCWDIKEELPWEHIDAGLKKEFLAGEYARAYERTTTAACRQGSCNECGVCQRLNVCLELEDGGKVADEA